jgi:aspartyl-tRNA(Asn)/glutamyl-tRNA(Gln) amidotransferase subunit A
MPYANFVAAGVVRNAGGMPRRTMAAPRTAITGPVSGKLTTISELARHGRERVTRPTEVVDALLSEAARRNADDHVFIRLLAGRAMSSAARAEARITAPSPTPAGPPTWPLLGLPVVVKDNIDMLGTATTVGSVTFARPVAVRDAAIVRQLDALGAVILGKTNLDEAALGASGRNPHFGRCVNPRRPECLSGGSSSGSAAAVAAGYALLGIGTDTLGSVRIPAALCGIVGFKPTHGRLSSDGVVPLHPAFDTLGLLTGNLQDALLAARALLPVDDAAPPVDAPPPAPLRLLHLSDAALGGTDSGVADDYRHMLELLRRSAAVRLLPCPAVDFAALSRAALWEVASGFARGWDPRRPGIPPGEELLPLLQRARGMPESELAAGRVLLGAAAGQLLAALAGADALFTPACPVADIGRESRLPKSIAWFVAPANVAGLPAVAWAQRAGGRRPSSLQLMAAPGHDIALLRAALELQRMLDVERGY